MATVWQNGRATRGREDQPMADSELARLQRRYRALTEQIRDLGFIATGSVIERYTVCTAAGCRCHADPAQRYREQIANRRRLDELITAMDEISTQARELLLAQLQPTKRSRGPRS